MTYEEAVTKLVEAGFLISMWSRDGDIQRLEVACSPLMFKEKCAEIEELLGDEFRAFGMPNLVAIWVEKKHGVSPDNKLKPM